MVLMYPNGILCHDVPRGTPLSPSPAAGPPAAVESPDASTWLAVVGADEPVGADTEGGGDMNQTFSHWLMFVLGMICASFGWLALAQWLAQKE